MTRESITRYWHAVELLQPQSAPKIEKRDSLFASFLHDCNAARPVMPWAAGSPAHGQPKPKDRVWSHTLFAHLSKTFLVTLLNSSLHSGMASTKGTPLE
jgi:hypothetical protein